MTYEEKGVWVQLVAVLITYIVYLGIVLGQLATTPLSEVDYATPLIITMGASIAVAIVLRIVIEVVRPSESQRGDTRDREISRNGERLGSWALIAGAAAALAFTLADIEHFWIANALYLGFVASAVLASIVKVRLYRRGF